MIRIPERPIGGERPYTDILGDVADLIGGDEDAFPERALTAVSWARVALLERTNAGADPGYVPTTGDEASSSVYTYEGGEHCFACAERRFGALTHDDEGELILANGDKPAIDAEGNRVHWDSIDDYMDSATQGHDFDDQPYVLGCEDCRRLIAAQVGEHERPETDLSLADVWREYVETVKERHQEYRDEREEYDGALERLTEIIADIPRGIRTFDELLQEVNERGL